MSRGRHRRGGWLNRLALVGCGLGIAAYITRQTPTPDIQGKVVIITGGSRGLGLALAEEFARQGARLALCARDSRRLEAARERIESLGAEVLVIPCDVTDQAQVQMLVDSALDRYGVVDILVNAASALRVGPVLTQDLQDFADVMDATFWGMAYATLAVLPHMLERQSGQIVNVASIAGAVSMPHLAAFDSAQSAAIGFARSLRAELAGTGIAVTTVLSGFLRESAQGTALIEDSRRSETWTGQIAASPLATLGTAQAARAIVTATRQGKAEVLIPSTLKALTVCYDLFPGPTLALLNRIGPSHPVERAQAIKIASEGPPATKSAFAD